MIDYVRKDNFEFRQSHRRVELVNSELVGAAIGEGHFQDTRRGWGVLPLCREAVCVFYHIYQPLRSGRIWHKVNF